MEERATKFTISGTPWREATRSRVNLTRMIASQVLRRDPHRNVTGNTPVFSTYAIGWDLPFCDNAADMATILAAVADPGSMDIATGRRIVPVTAHAAFDDGAAWKFTNGILRDFQVNVEAKKPTTLSTVWQFGGIEAAAYPDTTPAPAVKIGSPLETTFTIGDAVVFGGTLALTRDAVPAGFNLAGKAGSLKGKLAMDVMGKITFQLGPANALLAVGQRLALPVQVTMGIGSFSFGIDIPLATMQITSRRIVSNQLIDYSADLLALKTDAEPLARFSLST